MPAVPYLLVRDDSSNSTKKHNSLDYSSTSTKVLTAFVVVILFSIFTFAGLYLLRQHRRQLCSENPARDGLPVTTTSAHRRLAITTSPYGRGSAPIDAQYEKEMLMQEESPESPSEPVPEIRITFPEEDDGGDQSKSGRVVVVKISEQGSIGLEPYNEDHLPAYEKENSTRFQSLDLDRIGGLKESTMTCKS